METFATGIKMVADETALDVTTAPGTPVPSTKGPWPSKPVTVTTKSCGSPARLSTPGVIETSISTQVFCPVAAVRSSALDGNAWVIVVVCPAIVSTGELNPVTVKVPVPA